VGEGASRPRYALPAGDGWLLILDDECIRRGYPAQVRPAPVSNS
jgi:hypothetical protein